MSETPTSSAREIVDHYERYDESKRLQSDIGPLELARTQALMQRYLPAPPAVVLDIGGGLGVYALWLAKMGYHMHLVDVVPRHLQQARRDAEAPESPQLTGAMVGDAWALAFNDEMADAVVLHGPLYHLVERPERLRAVEEAWRTLRLGGVLLAFAITRYAGLMYGLMEGHVFDGDYYEMIVREVRTGRREDPPAWASTLLSAYFHHPDELAEELPMAGFEHETTLGVLGPAWMVPDLDGSWADEAEREVILAVARLTEDEPVLGPRLMGVGRKT